MKVHLQTYYSAQLLPDPNEEALELARPTDPVLELLKQGAGNDEELLSALQFINVL